MKLHNINKDDRWAIDAQVSNAPGSTPIPPNHVRLYHYTKVQDSSDKSRHIAAEMLRENGLDIGKARGTTYGEPNAVWASTELPFNKKVFAEFSIAMNDRRWGIGKPSPTDTPQQYESRHGDCYFQDSILPDEIIAVHEPWHTHYRYILDNKLEEGVKAGKYNYLLGKPYYGPAVLKIIG